MITVDHERADLMINLGAIPRSQLREQKKAKGLGTYLTADLIAEVEVLSDIKFTVRRDKVSISTYQTRL